MTENELRTAMGFDLCDCDKCRTQKPRTTTLEEKEPKTMTYSTNGYESALEILRTPEQRRALTLEAEAVALITAKAEAASAKNAEHFRSLATQRASRTKYPAPNPYASVLAKGGK